MDKKKNSGISLNKINAPTQLSFFDELFSNLFPSLPRHYPLRKKIQITKQTSIYGLAYDLLLDILSLVVCGVYVASNYIRTYQATRSIFLLETVIIQFFLFDFILNWYLRGNWTYFTDSMTLVDLVSIFPTYFIIISNVIPGYELSIVSIGLIKVLRVVRIMRIFKTLRFFSRVRRKVYSLVLTMCCMVFICSGAVFFLENNMLQRGYDCKYINEATNYEPSCSRYMPAAEMTACDCEVNRCYSFYTEYDSPGEPSHIFCLSISFFRSAYLTIVTMALLGYGDSTPATTGSKVVMILFILTSFVLIPMHLNELAILLSKGSPYRKKYTPLQNENHVIICGFVNDRQKLEKFFKEFFHPDRTYSMAVEFHAVILAPVEPSDDIRTLITLPTLESRVTYVIGSALYVEDLKRARADIASGMFFLCNAEVGSVKEHLEDAATVMRALSVSNFNPNLDCLVQVLRPEDRTILKDSDVDVILCLDEFKTALQAKNAICPGYSTFIENLFHSFGSVSPVIENVLDPWYKEYLHGAKMEVYCMPIEQDFLRAMQFDYHRLMEAIYTEFEVIIIGCCNANKDEIVLNPTKKDMGNYKSFRTWFQDFNVILVMADDQEHIDRYVRAMSDITCIDRMFAKMAMEEDIFPIQHVTRSIKQSDSSLRLKRNPVITTTRAMSLNNKIKRGFSYLNGKEKGGGGNIAPVEYDPNDYDDSDSDGDTGYVGLAIPVGTARNSLTSNDSFVGDERNSLTMARRSRGSSVASDLEERAQERANMVLPPSVDEHMQTGKYAKPLRKANTAGGNSLMKPALANMKKLEDAKRHSGTNKASPRPETLSPLKKKLQSLKTSKGPKLDLIKPENIVKAKKKKIKLKLKPLKRDVHVDAVSAAEFYRPKPDVLGQPSSEIFDAGDVGNHIIVFGNDAQLPMFVAELRRPIVRGESYHPIIIVSPEEPYYWKSIKVTYNDVYYLKGSLIRSAVFARANATRAFAVVLLASRDGVTKVEEETIDSELTCASNMAVLNATIMRRVKRQQMVRHNMDGNKISMPGPKVPIVAIPSSSSATIRRRTRDEPNEDSEPRQRTRTRSGDDMEKSVTTTDAGNLHGRFASKRASMRRISTMEKGGEPMRRNPSMIRMTAKELPGPVVPVGRRASTLTVGSKQAVSNEVLVDSHRLEEFWDATDTHHMLPVFASGRAYVPSCFETLLVQSFFGILTPLLCETLVCGQNGQCVQSVDMPSTFNGRRFIDLLRLFARNRVTVIGLYRAPQIQLGAALPYVFLMPPPNTVLQRKDKIYIYGKPSRVSKAVDACLNLTLK